MSADYRLFIKVHNGFPEHAKTAELSDRAFRKLVEAWCLCSRNLNDGKLTKTQTFRLFSQKVRVELVEAGWLAEAENGWEMRNYLDHQMSAAQVADLRLKRSDAGRLGGQARASHLASALAKSKQTGSKPVADIDVDVDVDRKATTEVHTASAAPTQTHEDRFQEFWAAYPRSESKKTAGAAWTKALKRGVTAADLIAHLHRQKTDPARSPDTIWPYATTWLNHDRWNDEFTPHANGLAAPKPSTSDQRVNTALEAGRRVAAARDSQLAYATNREIGS